MQSIPVAYGAYNFNFQETVGVVSLHRILLNTRQLGLKIG